MRGNGEIRTRAGRPARLEGVRSIVTRVAVGLGASLVMACASGGRGAPPVAAGPEVSAPAPLEPGDAIQVAFSREPDQSGQYEIDEDGRVALPFLDVWTVRGVAPDSLRAKLLAAYRSQLRNQTIDVRLLRRVRVLGAVQKPGLYLVDGTMTLADVVAKAGGATSEGSLDHVRIFRDGAEVRADLRAGGPAFEQLHSGDQVYLSEKSWLSRHAATMIGATVSAAVGLIVVLTR
jgi:protein involved in polysaccharide export with SLBB domain